MKMGKARPATSSTCRRMHRLDLLLLAGGPGGQGGKEVPREGRPGTPTIRPSAVRVNASFGVRAWDGIADMESGAGVQGVSQA